MGPLATQCRAREPTWPRWIGTVMVGWTHWYALRATHLVTNCRPETALARWLIREYQLQTPPLFQATLPVMDCKISLSKLAVRPRTRLGTCCTTRRPAACPIKSPPSLMAWEIRKACSTPRWQIRPYTQLGPVRWPPRKTPPIRMTPAMSRVGTTVSLNRSPARTVRVEPTPNRTSTRAPELIQRAGGLRGFRRSP